MYSWYIVNFVLSVDASDDMEAQLTVLAEQAGSDHNAIYRLLLAHPLLRRTRISPAESLLEVFCADRWLGAQFEATLSHAKTH